MFTFPKFGGPLAALLLLGLKTAHADPAYIIQDLGSLNSTYPYSYGNGINQAGDVCGDYVSSSSVDGVGFALDSFGDLFQIGSFTSSSPLSYANDINDVGVVVGRAASNTAYTRAFAWFLDDYGNPQMIDLGFGAGVGEAKAVNNRGQAAGVGAVGSDSHAFFFPNDGTASRDLGTAGLESQAFGIAPDGKVVGYQDVSSTSSGEEAFETSSNGLGLTNLGFLSGGSDSEAFGINLADQVIGDSFYGTNKYHAFRTTSGGTITSSSDLGALPSGTNSIAKGINTLGQVVGASEYSTSAYTHAFLYDTSLHDLNMLVNPYQLDSANAFTLLEADRLNDNGQIVGYGTFKGQTHGFILTPNEVTALVLAPAYLAGGQTTTATITLRDPAPVGGLPVSLTSSLPSYAAVPPSITVPEGATSATFTVTPAATPTPFNFPVITAQTTNGTGMSGLATATLYLLPTQATALALSPTQVYGGTTFTGTVTSNKPAPAGGTPVALKSANPTLVTVPRSVTIPPGATSASFTGTVHNATKATTTVILSAAGSYTATLMILPTTVKSVTIAPGPGLCGGDSATGTVTLSAPAPSPSGATVTLASNNTGLTFPGGSTISIPAGGTSGQFSIATGYRTTIQIVTVTASYQGVAATTTETLKPTVYGSSSGNTLAVAPNYVYGHDSAKGSGAGAVSLGTLNIPYTAPSPNGTTVHLSSSDSSVYFDSTTFVIPAGNTSGQFGINAVAVSTLKAVTITATYSGGSATANLNLQPTSLASFTPTPVSVYGNGTATSSGAGAVSTGTVTLTAPAPYPNGTTVTLSSNPTSLVSVPANVVVPAGNTTATFGINAAAVTAQSSANLTATAGGVSKSSPVIVLPTALSSVTAAPDYVLGNGTAVSSGAGAVSTGTVTLMAPAPYPNGTTVALSSSSPSVMSVPASVVVPAGNTSATFGINAAAVKTATSVTFTAKTGAVSKTTTVTVEPTTLASLSLVNGSLYGGATQTALVTLTAPAPYPNGTTVTLSSSSPTLASVPSSVVVPAGNTTGSFTITAPYAVASPDPLTITATGGIAKTVPITILPTVPTYVSVASDNGAGGVTAGTSVTGTVTLSYPAPYPNGRAVSLTTSDGNIAVPSSVVVPSGNTTATFSVNAGANAAGRTATITAIVTGVKVTAQVAATH